MFYTRDPNRASIDASAAKLALLKPFKTPFVAKPIARDQPTRKRKRVSYKNQDAGGNDSDSDTRKKKRKGKDDGPILADNVNYNPLGKLPIKDFALIAQAQFTIPTMRRKDGTIIPVIMSGSALGIRPLASIAPRPAHDPMAAHAVVLYDPTIDHRETDEERKERLLCEDKEKAAKEAREKAGSAGLVNPHKSLRQLLGLDDATKRLTTNKKVPVVIDPILGQKLRPHQIEGVKFLYKATTGAILESAYGCIMADEMGLGKTMQCVALVWTLLRQSPRAGKSTIDKAVIACPATLVRNWQNELDKWLGKNSLGYLTIDGKGTKEQMVLNVRRWVAASGRGISQPVMIVSYETLRSLSVELQNCKIGLLLADEGHRLKNSENQTYTALNGLNVQRRVIVTGTPIQNDLTEYFSLLNFANPGLLGTKADFRKNYEIRIIRGRDADASEKHRQESEKIMGELIALVNKFVIRRTNDILSKWLPVKYEHVVFCRPSPLQVSLYQLFATSPEIQKLLRGTGSQPLKAIDLLRKLCNTPQLLDLPNALTGCAHLLPEGFCGASSGTGVAAGGGSTSRSGRAAATAGFSTQGSVHPEYSGKMAVLARFLHRIRYEKKEKVVLISNFTQTLDLFERLCKSKQYGYFRLDGTMATNKRQKIVDEFNDPETPQFVFLLSSKAGGCGINLIGANRLVLFDPDWNPASDQQALARIWRDGQKRECFIYRFISTGTIEEKIFQRQAAKQALSASMIDNVTDKDGSPSFSAQDLRKLFLYKGETNCETHETFKCKRCRGGKQIAANQALLYGDASTWNHFENPELKNNHDDLLRAETGGDDISFVFQYVSH